MEWPEKQQHESQMEGLNCEGSNGDMFIRVMTDEQMEVLSKQIAAYATICEQLEELHRSLTCHYDPTGLMLRNPYCTPLMTSFSGPRIPRRQRWNPTSEQLQILERIFDQGNETPSREKVKDITAELANHGQIAETNVYNWFQNRRARLKKKHLVAAEANHIQSEAERVIESSANGEKLEVSAGNSVLFFDQERLELQQPMFLLEGSLKPVDGSGSSSQMALHGSMLSKAKMENLLEEMAVNPESYNPYIQAENYNPTN